MKYYQDFTSDDEKFAVGNQPRKSVLRKSKKEHAFKKFEHALDELDHHRHTYKRAADKNITRAQLRDDQLIF
jgi:hypothetical protein